MKKESSNSTVNPNPPPRGSQSDSCHVHDASHVSRMLSRNMKGYHRPEALSCEHKFEKAEALHRDYDCFGLVIKVDVRHIVLLGVLETPEKRA